MLILAFEECRVPFPEDFERRLTVAQLSQYLTDSVERKRQDNNVRMWVEIITKHED